jgi:hypothetical protein
VYSEAGIAISTTYYIFQEAGKELLVAPLVVDRLAVAGIQGFQDTGKAQMAELLSQLVF